MQASRHPNQPALAGLALLAPVLCFWLSLAAGQLAGMPHIMDWITTVDDHHPLMSPLLFMAMPLTALCINAWHVASLRFRGDGNHWETILRIRTYPVNLAIIVFAGAGTGMMTVYLVLENFIIMDSHACLVAS